MEQWSRRVAEGGVAVSTDSSSNLTADKKQCCGVGEVSRRPVFWVCLSRKVWKSVSNRAKVTGGTAELSLQRHKKGELFFLCCF